MSSNNLAGYTTLTASHTHTRRHAKTYIEKTHAQHDEKAKTFLNRRKIYKLNGPFK